MSYTLFWGKCHIHYFDPSTILLVSFLSTILLVSFLGVLGVLVKYSLYFSDLTNSLVKLCLVPCHLEFFLQPLVLKSNDGSLASLHIHGTIGQPF